MVRSYRSAFKPLSSDIEIPRSCVGVAFWHWKTPHSTVSLPHWQQGHEGHGNFHFGFLANVERTFQGQAEGSPERGRPALDWESRVRFRGQGALAPRRTCGARAPRPRRDPWVRFRGQGALAPRRNVRSEGAPPSTGSRVRFRGQGALAPRRTSGARAPRPRRDPWVRFRGQGALAPRRTCGARAPRPRLGIPGSVSRARCPRSVK